MIRFLLRFIAFFVLAAACVLGIGDTARSLAASAWRLMSLQGAASIAAPFLPDGLPTFEGRGVEILSWAWLQIAHWPASLTLAVVALFLFGVTARTKHTAQPGRA